MRAKLHLFIRLCFIAHVIYPYNSNVYFIMFSKKPPVDKCREFACMLCIWFVLCNLWCPYQTKYKNNNNNKECEEWIKSMNKMRKWLFSSILTWTSTVYCIFLRILPWSHLNEGFLTYWHKSGFETSLFGDQHLMYFFVTVGIYDFRDVGEICSKSEK